jgi:NAD-dependent SIR2 family protein deacetylase
VHYKFVTSLRRNLKEVKETSLTHKFIRTLRDGGRLVRCYSQNVDGLEAREGLCVDLSRGKGNKKRFMKKVLDKPRPSTPIGSGDDCDGGCEVVQLHGDLEKLRCTLCLTLFSWGEEEEEMMLNGQAPKCPNCAAKNDTRQESGKRGTPVGFLRANIVLYGEEHPQNQLLAPITTNDLGLNPDALIIMGTSLKVYGLKKLVKEWAKAVHASDKGKGKVIFVNREQPSESVWNDFIDYHVQMDTDDWVSDLKQRREDLWLRQGELQVPITKKKAPKRKAENEGLEPHSAKKLKSGKKAPNAVGEDADQDGKPKTVPSTPKKAPKRKAEDTGLNGESAVPTTPKEAAGRPKKKTKATTAPEPAPALSKAPSSQPVGLLTPPPSRGKSSKRKDIGDSFPDIETLPLKKQRLKLSAPKMQVWKDREKSGDNNGLKEVSQPPSPKKVLEPKSSKVENLDQS